MMKTVKEFLESSTIHGLVYISTTSSFVRLLWVGIVITGFSGAAILIQQSFSSWAVSPVSTTIETLPITDLDLPNVTVCPPRNTFTSLNPDLVMARNIDLDQDKRKELVDSVPDSVYDSSRDAEYLNFLQYRKDSGQDKYRDWYMGISRIDFPRRDPTTGMYSLSLDTTKTSGYFKSPGFGEPFDDSFEPLLKTELYITVLREVHGWMTPLRSIVLEIEFDIEDSVEHIKVEEQLREMTEQELYEDLTVVNPMAVVRTSYQTNRNKSVVLDPSSGYMREEYNLYIGGTDEEKKRR